MKRFKDFLIPILIVMGTQSLSYFCIKYFIHNYHVLSSVLTVPFIKYFVYFYDIWYPFVFFVAYLIFKHSDKKFYYSLVFSMGLASILAHITFISYPTVLSRPEITVNSFTDFAMYVTYKLDTPAINCLPSVHCLYCFILSYYVLILDNFKVKYKIPIVLVFMLIVASTLFTYQHIIEDVILALIYTIISILIVSIIFNKTQKKDLL